METVGGKHPFRGLSKYTDSEVRASLTFSKKGKDANVARTEQEGNRSRSETGAAR